MSSEPGHVIARGANGCSRGALYESRIGIARRGRGRRSVQADHREEDARSDSQSHQLGNSARGLTPEKDLIECALVHEL